jgi:hypothetical protein
MKKPKRTLSEAELTKARSKTKWDLGNDVLYRLCKKHPHHAKDDEIIAKTWLIGRSYAAAIERRRTAAAGSDDFYVGTVAPTIRRSGIDSWLRALPTKNGTAEKCAAAAIETHKRVLNLFKQITGLEKRSLASKYLHFHRPDLFFIYDSRAMKAIRVLTPDSSHCSKIIAATSDQEYLRFYRRCLWLQTQLRNTTGRELTPRAIDKILLFVADR